MAFAPIVLFVYNRPAHTRQTVVALQQNILAQDSDLIIFSDAPKTELHAEAVHNVREYIHQIDGFKSVTIVERENNFGLARSIIDGVTKVVNERGRIIVLEDDIVTAPYFLGFMNTALDSYHDKAKVMHISGYMFPIDTEELHETFFLRTTSCWGWGTWARAWRHFEKNPQTLISEFTEQSIYRFNMDGAYNFWEHVMQNMEGMLDTWAVFWYASVFQKGGLCLHPKNSMVSNIGHDGTGVHCGQSDKFAVQLAKNPITYFESNLSECALALNRTKTCLTPAKPTFTSRISRSLKNLFSRN
jgi:hypothetical protein